MTKRGFAAGMTRGRLDPRVKPEGDGNSHQKPEISN